jgi:cation diffusion facilitator family transporter
MIVSGSLAALKITVGLMANSTAVVSDGVESAADVFASAIVLFGLSLAAKPPDAEHPYGHGRLETLSGLAVGIMLGFTGAGICFQAARHVNDPQVPAAFALWPLIVSMIAKSGLAFTKFRVGRRIKSEALEADAWNDSMDILSAFTALVAVGIAVWNPAAAVADHYGAFIVGVIVVSLGIRVVYQTTAQLMDRMPDGQMVDDIRRVAVKVPGARDVEKCFARKTGLRYHVDLHLEVDPEMTVRESHQIAHDVRARIVEELDWVADVLVHVEPYAAPTIETGPQWKTGS